jgi:hypothetical protein
MAMIKKEVGGNAEDYKYIKDVRNYDGKAMGGVQRATFEGSNDSRPIGALGPNVVPPMKTSPGNADEGPVYADYSYSKASPSNTVSGGPAAGSVGPGQAKVASEDIKRLGPNLKGDSI